MAAAPFLGERRRRENKARRYGHTKDETTQKGGSGRGEQRHDGKAADRYSMPPWRFAAAALSARPNFLAYRVQDLGSAIPRLARLFGLSLLTWTVRTAQDRTRAAHLADQMIFEGFRP